jgi:hypothetical protein
MKLVAVTKVHDPGAAEVARDELESRGMVVELKRLGNDPYFGSVGIEIEVRVPADRVAEAEAILARLAVEAEEAALSQSAESPPVEEAAARDRPARPPMPRALVAGVAALVVIAFGLVYLFRALY